ncbi:hypothetical protein FB451DRAFT_286320 [Mycena latifolia]|nr:hypothetical protein FB451DRAFT_286320 [Mycena latifolia]
MFVAELRPHESVDMHRRLFREADRYPCRCGDVPGARGKNLMLAHILPSGGATLLRNGCPLFTPLAGVVERIPFDYPQELSEIISAQTIIVDGDIVIAWTSYQFLIDNGIDHASTDIWSLEGRRFSSALADNSYKAE